MIIGSEVHLARELDQGRSTFMTWYELMLTFISGDYATISILPPPRIEVPGADIQPRGLHLIKGDKLMVVSYARHGIV